MFSTRKLNDDFHGNSFVKVYTYMCVYLSIYIYAIDAKQNLTAFHVNYGIKQVQALSWLLFGALTLIHENKFMTVAVASS